MQIAGSKKQSSIESNINLFHAPLEAKDLTFDRQTFNHMFVFLFSGYLWTRKKALAQGKWGQKTQI